MSATLISRKSIYDTQGISRMRRYNLLLLIKAVKNNEENYFQTNLIEIKEINVFIYIMLITDYYFENRNSLHNILACSHVCDNLAFYLSR